MRQSERISSPSQPRCLAFHGKVLSDVKLNLVMLVRERLKRGKTKPLRCQPGKPFLNGVQLLPFISLGISHYPLHTMQLGLI